MEFSRDLGKTWEQAQAQPRFTDKPEYAEHDGPTVSRLWHIEPGRESEPGVLYAGVQPAALFKSEDGGVTWREVEGLSRHPTRPEWMPGFGGLCLHSIALDQDDMNRMWVRRFPPPEFSGPTTEERTGGRANRGVRADFDPSNPLPEWGQCPHKLLSHPSNPGRLYQQNHCGVYRTDDGGEDWRGCHRGPAIAGLDSSRESIPETPKSCTWYPGG